MDRFVFNVFIKVAQKQSWSEYCSNDKCMRMECKNKRGKKNFDRIKFLKCTKCRIASYLSTRCAKLDWNKGYHKEYCKLYYDVGSHDYE